MDAPPPTDSDDDDWLAASAEARAHAPPPTHSDDDDWLAASHQARDHAPPPPEPAPPRHATDSHDVLPGPKRLRKGEVPHEDAALTKLICRLLGRWVDGSNNKVVLTTSKALAAYCGIQLPNFRPYLLAAAKAVYLHVRSQIDLFQRSLLTRREPP